jgi:hypothetical protein
MIAMLRSMVAGWLVGAFVGAVCGFWFVVITFAR